LENIAQELALLSDEKSSDLKKKNKKVDSADNMLSIVAKNLQSEGKYTGFGRHIAQELASLGDEIAEYCKKK
jgi:hypothetical protein